MLNKHMLSTAIAIATCVSVAAEASVTHSSCSKVNIADQLTDDIKNNYQIDRLRDVYYECSFDGTTRLYRAIGYKTSATIIPSESNMFTSVYANNWGAIHRLDLDGTVFYATNPGSTITVNVGGDDLRKERDSASSSAWQYLSVLDADVIIQNQDILSGQTFPDPTWTLRSKSLYVENGGAQIELKAHFDEGITLRDSSLTGGGSIFTTSLESYGNSGITMSDLTLLNNAGNASFTIHDGHLKVFDDLDNKHSAIDMSIASGAIFEIVNTSNVLFEFSDGSVQNDGTILLNGSGPTMRLGNGVTFNHTGELNVNTNAHFALQGDMNSTDGKFHSINGNIDLATLNLNGDTLFEFAHVGTSGVTIDTLNVLSGHSALVVPDNHNNENLIKITDISIKDGAALSVGSDLSTRGIEIASGGSLELLSNGTLYWQANPNSANVINALSGSTLAFSGTDTHTFAVDGSVAIDGTFVVRIDGDNNTHDKLRVGVTSAYDVSLGANSALEIQGIGNDFNTFAQSSPVFRIIEGTGSLTGQFANISDDLHFYDFTANYTSRDVELSIIAHPVATTHTVTATKNHKNLQGSLGKAVTRAAASVPPSSPGTPTTPVEPPHPSCGTTGASGLCITGNQTLDNHLNQYLLAPSTAIDQFHNTASGEVYANHMMILMRQSEAVANSVASYLLSREFTAAPSLSQNSNTWLDISQFDGTIDTFDNISGFEYSNFSLVLGHDLIANSNATAGLFLGYGESDLRETAHDHATADDKHFSLGAYGAFGLFGGSVDTSIGFNRSDSKVNRAVILNSNQLQANAAFDSSSYFIRSDYRYPINIAQFTIQPFVGAEYLSLELDGISETSADQIDLTSNDGSSESLKLRAGLMLGYSFETAMGRIAPYSLISYTQDTSADDDSKNSITLEFAQANGLIDPHLQVGHNRGEEIVSYDVGIEISGVNQRGYVNFAGSQSTHGEENGFEIGYVFSF